MERGMVLPGVSVLLSSVAASMMGLDVPMSMRKNWVMIPL